MSGISYLDFDLKIERAGSRYRALVLNSPAGQASQSFDAPFSDLEVENFLLRLGRPRKGVRRADSPEVVAVKKFGGELFGATFREEVLACLRSSMDEATRQNAGLRIRLHLTEVPELADLPWEFLYYQSMNRFLVLSDVTPVVRYLDMPERINPHSCQTPLRVLAMISSPSDFPALEVEKEWEKLHGALAALEQRGLVMLERLDEATPAALRRKLRQGEFHIFHFIGHGGFDPNTQDGVLILEDEQHRGRRMSGADLGMILHDHRSMRLAVLNACEGARASRSDPFGGTAQSLVQQGMPAVIAMQFEITDQAAITFAQEFYQALADNYPADAALAEARKAICDEGFVPEWGTPVLYLRARDGRLFDIKQMNAEERAGVQAETLVREADKAIAQEKWTLAGEKLEQLLAIQPENADAQTKLRQMRQLEQGEKFYRQGCDAAQAGRWREAVENFQLARGISTAHKDVETRLAQAQLALDRENAARAAPTSTPPVVPREMAPPRPQPVPQPTPEWSSRPSAVVKSIWSKFVWVLAGIGGMFVALVIIGFAIQGHNDANKTNVVGTGPAAPKADTGDATKGTEGAKNEPSVGDASDAENDSNTSANNEGRNATPPKSSSAVEKAPRVATKSAATIPAAPPPPKLQPPPVSMEDQVINKYLEAIGDRGAWSAVTSRLITGSYTMLPANITGRYTAYARAPNKNVEEYSLPGNMFMRQGFDGVTAWSSDPKQGVKQLYGKEALEAALDADFYADFHMHENYASITYAGEQTLGNQSVNVLQLTMRSGSARTFYLSKITGLPLRADGVGPDGTPVQVYFEDYRVVDGIRMPFRVKQISSQYTMITQVVQVKHNVMIDESIFSKPRTP